MHLLKNDAFFPQEITRTSQTYRRQNQSACPACCAFLSRRARLPWHAQKMCAVTIVGTDLKGAISAFLFNILNKDTVTQPPTLNCQNDEFILNVITGLKVCLWQISFGCPITCLKMYKRNPCVRTYWQTIGIYTMVFTIVFLFSD